MIATLTTDITKSLFEKNPDLSSPFAAACATTAAAVAGVFFNQIFFFSSRDLNPGVATCSSIRLVLVLLLSPPEIQILLLSVSSHFHLLLLLLIAYLPMLLFCNILGKHKKSAIALRGAGSDFCTLCVCVSRDTEYFCREL
jgi:hypothetical protein